MPPSFHRPVVSAGLLAFLTLLAAPAAEPPPPAPSITETVAVRVAQVDVVVRDREGRIVRDLPAEAFAVYENGQRVEIAAVDEWGKRRNELRATQRADRAEGAPSAAAVDPPRVGNAAPPSAPLQADPRAIVLLFDNTTAHSALRVHLAKRAAREFARKHVREGDLVAVYQLDLVLRAVGGFSPDPAEVASAVDRVVWMPPTDLSDDMAESVLGGTTAGRNRGVDQERLERRAILQGEMLDWTRNHVYESLAGFGQIFEGLPGKRMLVLISGGFPLTAPGDTERLRGGFTPALRELIRALGRAGVTVYTIDVGDELPMADASQAIDWRIGAGKLGLDESFLTDIGLDREFAQGSSTKRRQILGLLAAETGGRMLTHSDLSKAFEVIEEESTHFYRLTIHVPEAQGERYRRIEVRMKPQGLTTATRRGRYPDVFPRGDTFATAEAEEREVRAAPLSLRGVAELLPRLSAVEGQPIAMVVEAVGPVALRQDSAGNASVNLDFWLVARSGGEIVRRYSRTLDARVRAEGVEAVRRAFRVEGRLAPLPPGRYEVQAGVRITDPAQFGTWRQELVVPEAPATDALVFEALLLAPAEDAGSPLLLKPDTEEGAADPLELGDQLRLVPSVEADYAPAGRLVAAFWIRGLPRTDERPTPFELRAQVIGPDGEERSVASQLLSFRPATADLHRGVLALDLAGLGEGGYSLELQAHESRNEGRSAKRRASFRVRAADPAGGGSPDRPVPAGAASVP